MATASLFPLPRFVAYSNDGAPLAGGFVYTYEANTTTPAATWQDSGETILNSNPVLLDANGSCLLYGSGNYSLVTTDSNGNQIPAYSGLVEDILSTIPATANDVLVGVLNIATLRAATSTTLPQTQCYVLGYYAEGDGGEGPFW
jgi:hypothetical protein